MSSRAPSLAVWKFASCDGCQLSVLDCEDELLALTDLVGIAHFTEMSSVRIEGPYDVSLVEGSITTSDDAQRLQMIRDNSRVLVSIGACATAGGIQSLRNFAEPGGFAHAVYAHPEYLRSLETATAIAEHVQVDYELHGCPIDRSQLLELLTALVVGRAPVLSAQSVCQECKARGTVCLLVTRNVACLGPVTRAGCAALCPSLGRGCFGCFGPRDGANAPELSRRLGDDGRSDAELVRLYRSFTALAPAFLDESQRLERRAVQVRSTRGADS